MQSRTRCYQFLLPLAVAWLLLKATVVQARQRMTSHLPDHLHRDLVQDGHARLPRLLTSGEASEWLRRVVAASRAEEAACSVCSARAIADPSDSTCYCCPAPAPDRSFFRARRLAQFDPSLESLPRHPAIVAAAAAALAVPRVRLYQWSSFLKAPGEAASGWHQDAAASPLRGDKAVTVWIALSDVPAAVGSLRFATGSHLPGVPIPSLRDVPLVERLVKMSNWSDADVERMTGLPLTDALAMSAGDATMHLGWTLHSALPNTSPDLRVAIALQYVADGARIYPDLLELDEESGASSGDPLLRRGVRFDAADGAALYVRLLADDAITWTQWLRARPPLLIPGSRMEDE